jgi:hypothetical protein
MINEAPVHTSVSNRGKTNERPCLIHQAISEYQVLKARERPSLTDAGEVAKGFLTSLAFNTWYSDIAWASLSLTLSRLVSRVLALLVIARYYQQR